MSKHMPQVPPENRSDKGPGDNTHQGKSRGPDVGRPPENLAEQGRQGDIKQNTTNQGYQQDR